MKMSKYHFSSTRLAMVGKLDGAKHCQVCGNTKIAKFRSGSMDQGSSSGEHSANYATTCCSGTLQDVRSTEILLCLW